MPDSGPDGIKTALSEDLLNAMTRERDELKEKLGAQEAAECASCGGELLRGEGRVSAKESKKKKDEPEEEPEARAKPAPKPPATTAAAKEPEPESWVDVLGLGDDD